MTMNCLVTGGAGFIGSHVARRLLNEGHRVWIIDNLKTGFESNVPENAEFIEGDIADDIYGCIQNAGIDVVFHFAGQSSGENSFYEPLYDLHSNGEGTLRLLEFCRNTKVQRFLFSSSMSVYRASDALNVKESEHCFPHSPYGATKILSEHYVRFYSRYGISYTIFRLFSVYGSGQNLENMAQGIVSIYMSFLLNGNPIHVKGSLERYRDFIYVDDIVNAYMLAWKSPFAQEKVFNLGTGIKTTVGELIDQMKKLAGNTDHPVFVNGSTPGDIKGITADIGSIKDTLSWNPSVRLDEGLSKMLTFYQLFSKKREGR